MIQNTKHKNFASENQAIAYKERLTSWTVARLLPNMQRITVARFRSRSDADGHVQCLRQLMPDAHFVVVFDCQRNEALI